MTASCLVLVAAMSMGAAAPTATVTHSGTITDQLVSPARLAIAPDGGLLVTDPPAMKVLQYDAAGVFVAAYTVAEGPTGIAVVPGSGNLVVSRLDGKVGVYSPAMVLAFLLDPAPLTMSAPNDIAVDPANGEIYVTDSELHQVLVFSSTTGALLRAWGMEGTGLGQFVSPQAIALSPATGHVIVADLDNFRIEVFDTQGTLQYKFGYRTLYVGNTQVAWMARTEGLALDSCGNIYVADALMGTVRVFSPVGKEIDPGFTPPINYGTNAGDLRIPCDVAIDAAGTLYVASTANRAVEVYTTACTSMLLAGQSPAGMPDLAPPPDVTLSTRYYSLYPDNPLVIAQAITEGRFVKKYDFNNDRRLDARDLGEAVAAFGAGTVDDFMNMAGSGQRDTYPYSMQPPHLLADLPNLCGRCHSMNGAPGGMLTDWGQANLCVSCHTPGGRAMAMPVDAADDSNSHPWGVAAANPPAVPGPGPNSDLNLHLDNGKIRCATCHDPHESLYTDSPYLRNSLLDAGICAECHKEVAEWQHAGHSDETADPWGHYDWSQANRAACRHCHSGNGYIDFSNGVPQNERNGAFRVLDCVVCHATHGKPQAQDLLRVYDTVTLPTTGPDVTLTDVGPMATCMVCHNGRVAPDDPGITPHYALGGVMLEGLNGITFGYTIASSPHGTLASCVDCHMAPSPAAGQPGAGKIGGHSFNIKVHDPADPDYGAENVENACNSPACHGGTSRSPELLLTTINRTAFGDYDGDGAIEGVQDETQGLMDLVLAQIEARGAIKLPSYPYWNTAGVPADQKALVEDAIWNWQFVVNSGDLGVHNTAYAVGLLQVTYRVLAGQDIPNAFLRYGTPITSLPKTMVTITSVNGGAPVQPGGAFTVNFTVVDDGGVAIPKASLDRLRVYVSGPASNYNRVIPQDTNLANFVQNGDGSFTYTAAVPFPSVYAAPLNDSAAITVGELTGQPLQDGTYTVLIEARRSFGSTRKAGDATFDFVVDADGVSPPALSPRQLVLQESCNACHNDLQLHGGNRKIVTGCTVCHTIGSEDAVTNPASTPGLTVNFHDMIHRLHRGADLPRVAATHASADPYLYEIAGFGGSLIDFSHVGFPVLPNAVSDCTACHDGAAQGNQVYSRVTRANCGSCHDDLDFTVGTVLDTANASVADGLLTEADLTNPAYRVAPGGVVHAFIDDTTCVFCHGPNTVYDAQKVHQHPTNPAQEGLEPVIEVVSVTGMTGGGGAYFQAGDRPAVQFKISNSAANPVQLVTGNRSNADRIEIALGGPTDLYQTIITAQRPWNNGALATAAANWVDNFAVDGTYTFIMPAIPANFPAQLNSIGEPPASQIFPFEEGWGQQYTAAGSPLSEGTYTVFAYGRRVAPVSGQREPFLSDVFDIRLGSAGAIEPYAGTTSTASCNACHGTIAFHGFAREGLQTCLVCHTAGTQDGATYESVDFRIMLHKLHNARNLTNLPYELNGNSGVADFSNLLISSMPGEAAECQVCHETDAWKFPPVRDNMRTWMVACTSCHDSDETAVHVGAASQATGFGEACDGCHGDGMPWSVERVHKSP